MQRPLLHLKSSGEHVALAEHHQPDQQIQRAILTLTHMHILADIYSAKLTRRQYRQSVQCIHSPPHTEIGTVSLSASNRYVGLDFSSEP